MGDIIISYDRYILTLKMKIIEGNLKFKLKFDLDLRNLKHDKNSHYIC